MCKEKGHQFRKFQLITFRVILGTIATFLISFNAFGEKRNVDLQWDSVEEASGYELEFTRILPNGDKKDPFTVKSLKNSWNGKMNPGQYEMRLRSIDDRDVPGEWSEASEFWVKVPKVQLVQPKSKEKIKTNEEKDFNVKFIWTPSAGAKKYLFEWRQASASTWEQEELDSTEYSTSLPVAQDYEWRVTPIMEGENPGELVQSPNSFTLIAAPIERPEIEKPISKFVEKLQWNKPEYTEHFNYRLLRRTKSKKWKLVDRGKKFDGNEIAFDLTKPSGKYMLLVKAYAKNRVPSKTAKLKFNVKAGLRSPAALQEAILKDSIEKPTNYYAIASYFITQITYEGENREQNTNPTFSTLGGTGRIGLGYQKPEKSWGLFGIVDLSGFTISGQTFMFAAAEAHGTWRFYQGANQVLLSGGLYYKQLPDLEGSSLSGFEGVGKATTMGPHAGFKYWIPFNNQWGLQLNGRVYYSLIGSGPSGQENESVLSYKFGVLGSYRWQKDWMFYSGYAYRLDAASYKSETGSTAASEGDVNLITLQGHYLNLLVEYAF